MIKHFYKTGSFPFLAAFVWLSFQNQSLLAQCPRVEAVMVNACGTEEDNEFVVIHAGASGFNTSDLQFSFPAQANNGGAVNDDININLGNQGASPCSLQPGNPAVVTGCTNVVPVGLGVEIPPNSILVLLTSAGSGAGGGTYDFSSLCGNGACIFVMSNACDRSVPGFAQTGVGTRQIIFQINNTACSQTIDYNIGNGNFVNNGGYYLPLTNTYGNAGCTVPPTSPAPRKPDIAPLVNITSCGPYQLPPIPGTALTSNVAYFTGPNRTGTRYKAGDLITSTTTLFAHDFAGACFDQETFSITITTGTPPTATLSGGGSSCQGIGLNLNFNITGTPPFTVQYTANGVLQAPLVIPTNSATFPVAPTVTTTYELFSVTQTGGCAAQLSGQAVVTVAPAPTAMISGGGPICPGDSATIRVDLTGQAPFQLVLAVNGTPQTPVAVSGNTYTVKVSPNINTTYTVSRVTGSDNCQGPATGAQPGEAVVTLSQAPDAQITPGSLTLCAGQRSIVDVTFNGTPPFTLTYAINGTAQPSVTVNDPQYSIDTLLPSGTYTFTLVDITTGTCGGTVGGMFMVEVLPQPQAVITGDSLICQGQKVRLEIAFTGQPPYQFNISANGVPGPTQVWGAPTFVFEPTPNVPTVYKVVNFDANGCTGTVSGTVNVKFRTPPTATLSGDEVYCMGSAPVRLEVAFVGSGGPYTFIYSANGVNQTSITTSSNPHVIPIAPTVGTIYRLVSMSENGCSGVVGNDLVFTSIFSSPTAQVIGDTVLCDGGTVQIGFDFTGTGPFTFRYAIDGVPQTQVTTANDPHYITRNITKTTDFKLLEIRSTACPGTVVDSTARATVNRAPSFANARVICNPNNLDYVVEFDVTGGTPPYTLVTGTGTFTGNKFTSAPILRGDNYNVIFRDTNNCANITVAGIAECNCRSAVGIMSQTPVNVCETAPAIVPAVSDSVRDNNDLLRYILQSNPGLPVGTVFAWSNQPRFSIQPGMVPGTTYYICAVVGNAGANNEVDLNDPCRAVATGTPIIFHARPTATLVPLDTAICQGQPLTLRVNLTGATPISFRGRNNGTLVPRVSNLNVGTYNWAFNLTQNAVITLDSVNDRFCPLGQVMGTANIKVFQRPAVGNITENCDFDKGTYTLTFDVTTGVPPFVVTGVTGTFTGRQFLSNPIPFGTPYNLVLRDSANCGTAALNGAGICRCTANAGTMASTVLQEVCAPVAAMVVHNGNHTATNGDVLRFVLHTSATNALGTVLATATTPNFAFDPAIVQPGITYYISAVVGRLQGGNLILNHPCLSVAPGTPVRWRSAPTADLAGDFDICPGETEALTVAFMGEPPYNFTYTLNNGAPIAATALQNTYTINATLIETTIYQLVSVTSGTCTGTAQGTATITVHESPVISNLQTSCTLDGDEAILTFTVDSIALGEIPVFLGNITGTYDPSTRIFRSNLFPTNAPYVITVRDTTWGCGEATATDSVACPCTTKAGTLAQTPLVLCAGATATLPPNVTSFLAPKDSLVYVLASGTDPKSWSVVATSPTPSFAFNPITMSAGTTYTIVAVAGNKGGALGVDIADPCLSLGVGPTVSWRDSIVLAIADTFDICQGDTIRLALRFLGDGPFNFTLDGGAAPQTLTAPGNTFTVAVAPDVSTVYRVTNLTGAGNCPGTVDGPVQIDVRRRPRIVNRSAICAADNESYVVEFDVTNADLASLTISGTVTGAFDPGTGHFISAPIPAFTPYAFRVDGVQANCGRDTIQGVSACRCLSSAGTLAQTPLNLCAGTAANFADAVGAVLDGKDTLIYVLATGNDPKSWTVVATSPTPSFAFNSATMQTSTAYTVAVLVGNRNAAAGVQLDDPCLAVALGPMITWRDSIALAIADSIGVCEGDTAKLTLRFSGNGPFNFTLDGGATPQTLTATGNTFALSLAPSASTVYAVTNLTGAGNCPGNVDGPLKVNVRRRPQIANRTAVCDADNETYTVEFDVNNANLADLTISGTVTGTLDPQTGHFVSAPIPAFTPYTFRVEGIQSNCGQDTIQGVSACRCVSSAGSLAQTPLNLCAGAMANFSGTVGAVLDGKDTLIYVLANGNNPATWAIVATSAVPSFSFNAATMQTGTLYTVAVLVGNKNATTGVQLNDVCLSVALGGTITWRPTITLAIADTVGICQGDTAELTLRFSGNGPFNFTLNGGAVPQAINATGNNFALSLAPTISTTYTVANLTGAGGCPGNADGPLQIEVRRRPQIANRTAVCAPDNETYVVTFEVTGADLSTSSVAITGSTGGNYDPQTGRFTSNPIPAFTPYNFKVEGVGNNCGQDTIQGSSACRCLTNAGTMPQTALTFCPGAVVSVPPATGFVLDGRDTLIYVLTTPPNQPNWTILATSPLPSFVFDPAIMQPGVVYYIGAVAGNKAPGGVDLADNCLSVAIGPTVTWRPAPMANLMGTDTICVGESAVLKVRLEGDGPFNFTLNDLNGSSQSYNTDQKDFSITVTPSANTTYNIMGLTGADGCPGAATGNASINVQPRPTADLRLDTTVCPGSPVSISMNLTGTAPFALTYSLNGTNLVPVTTTQNTYTLLLPNVQQIQNIALTGVRDAVCAGTADGTASIGVFPSPRATLLQDQTICDGDSTTLRLQLIGADSFNLNILGGLSPIVLSNVRDGASVVVMPTGTTTYSLGAVQAVGNTCPVTVGNPVRVTVKTLRVDAMLSNFNGFNLSCKDADDGAITLVLPNNGTGLDVRWSNGATQTKLMDLSPGNYSVTVSDPLGCTRTANYTLTEPPGLDVQLAAFTPSCFGFSDGGIAIEGIRGGLKPYVLKVEQITLAADTFPIRLANLKAGVYEVSIEDAKGCTLDSFLTVEPARELLVDLGDDVQLQFGDSLSLNAQTNFRADSFLWSPTTYLSAPTQQLTDAKPPRSILYKVVVRDSSGCTATDEISIAVKRDPRIFVPNALYPGLDSENGNVTVFGGPEVQAVKSFRIYDRWGNNVFERSNFPPNDPDLGWRGRWNGDFVNPGVFVYLAEILYFDGSVEEIKGDITVIR